MRILCDFVTDVFIVEKYSLATQNLENRFFTTFSLRSITWVYMGIHKDKEVFKGLEGVTGGYKGLQRVTGSYKELHGVTWGYTGLQGITWVTRDYRNLFSSLNVVRYSFLVYFA